MYNIRTKRQDSTPLNGGQPIKSFLEEKEVDITRFQPTAYVSQNYCPQGKLKGIDF